MRSDLLGKYSFSRGCLISKEAEGDRIIPPPCLRADIISQVHEELLHVGWERTFSILRNSYAWPGMRQDVQANCRLASAVSSPLVSSGAETLWSATSRLTTLVMRGASIWRLG